MSRTSRNLLPGFIAGLMLVMAGLPAAIAAAPVVAESTGVSLDAPAAADRGLAFGLTLNLPSNVAAFEGRLLAAPGAAELVGLAPLDGGTAFMPVEVQGGYAFGAYALQPSASGVVVQVVVAAHREGRIQLRLVIDAAADTSGNPIDLAAGQQVVTVAVGTAAQVVAAPAALARAGALRVAGKVKGSYHHALINRQDLDQARASWLTTRAQNAVCGPNITNAEGDANGDGCIDVLDVQALLAAQGQPSGMTAVAAPAMATGASLAASADIELASARLPAATTTSAQAVTYAHTFVVNSSLDTADANPGDGICADTLGRCTLRAAITEANYQPGADLISFNIAGTAPVTIQLSGGLPIINATSGGVTIDGYTEPGASVNTATVGSNAVPGIVVSGNGSSAQEIAFYLTSSGNTIRGLIINHVWRAIFMDGTNATNNYVIGNWIGFNANGTNNGASGYGVINNSGANHNVIGTPALADRNVIGNYQKGVDSYGAGTNYNTIQNNVFCEGPTGFTTATCNTGVDHDFGPKYEQLGGTGTNERNVFGPTLLQGVEYSHGWNPALAPRQDTSLTWQIDYNNVVGNWIGFRGDGSYDPAYRSAQNASTADNAQGINVYDSSNYNTLQGNYIASVYDGITMSSPYCTGNVAQGNVIGVSPLGQAAPLTGWGVKAFWNASYDNFIANTIRNAAKGGFGLVNVNNAGNAISTAYNIKMSQNIVTDTSGLAIQLFGTANNNVLPPVITSATTSTVTGTATNGATVEIYHGNRPAGQNGLPDVYIGSTTAASNGAWTFTLPAGLQAGYVITALQTRTDNTTSQLSNNVALGSPPTQPPAITSAAGATFQVGSAGSFTVTTTGSPTPSISESGALPGGVTFVDNGNGTATLAGTPASGTAGTYPLTITASNGVSPNATQGFTLTVSDVAGPVTIASDTYSRTLAGSWGTADTGGAWTLQGTASDFNVNGSAGTVSVPAGNTRGAFLAGATASDVTVTARISRDKLAVGGAQYVYLVARRIDGSNEYRAKVRFGTDGAVYIQPTRVSGGTETSLGSEVKVAGLTPAAGSYIWLKATFSGTNPTTISMKAWADGTVEPSSWALTLTDSTAALQASGAVGVKSYLSSAATNSPVTMSFDDFSATQP